MLLRKDYEIVAPLAATEEERAEIAAADEERRRAWEEAKKLDPTLDAELPF